MRRQESLQHYSGFYSLFSGFLMYSSSFCEEKRRNGFRNSYNFIWMCANSVKLCRTMVWLEEFSQYYLTSTPRNVSWFYQMKRGVPLLGWNFKPHCSCSSSNSSSEKQRNKKFQGITLGQSWERPLVPRSPHYELWWYADASASKQKYLISAHLSIFPSSSLFGVPPFFKAMVLLFDEDFVLIIQCRRTHVEKRLLEVKCRMQINFWTLFYYVWISYYYIMDSVSDWLFNEIWK